MFSRLRNISLILLVLGAAGVLSACGESHTRIKTGTYAGESGKNAPYLNVGPLIYEVQLSRELNPYNSEDAEYLDGLSEAERKLNAGEEWFGVFLQVYNETSQEQLAASDISISDTQENLYTPLSLGEENRYAYRPAELAAKAQIPAADTTADLGPTEGALLLFKIKVVSLDNRPLTIRIVDPNDPSESASAELDV